MKESFILKLYKSKDTVFTFKQIAILLNETSRDKLKSKVKYYVDKGVIKAVRRGIYVKPKYNKLELATKIYTPSYISLETVLAKEGVIFQYYKSIFVISCLSKNLEVDNNNIIIKKIKNNILFDAKGIKKTDNYSIATKERAFLDALYLYKNYYFDNLKSLDWKKVFDLVEIYNNKKLIKRLNSYFKDFKNA